MSATNSGATIVLIEDHAILREALRAMLELEPDLRVVGEAGTAMEGVRAVAVNRPALAITDLYLPDEAALRIVAKLRAAKADLRVLVLTAYTNEEYVRAALRAGADGYVAKQASRSELLQAIRSILDGRKYFSAAVSAAMVSGLRCWGDRDKESGQVSEREHEILTGIALGKSNKRLAATLRLSVKTIEKHRANGMRKLDLHNTAEVTLFAVRNGWVELHQEQLA